MPAQNLPVLKSDAAITSGTLKNGISYYLVTNASMKGMADFALVRKGCMDTLSARQELSSLPHFNKTVPYKFLSRKGIGCRPEGYMTYKDEATVFRFDDVPVFDQAASDTTLLMLFDLIASQPCQHAVVVAGDIKPAEIIEKMKVFSLMVPSRNPKYTKPAYSFKPGSGIEYTCTEEKKASVTVDFRASRTDDLQMQTILPFMSQLYALDLREIASERLKDAFMSRHIPVSGYSIDYTGSGACLGDEHFSVKVEVPEAQIVPATLAVSAVLSEIASQGVEVEEYKMAKETVLGRMLKPQTNDDLVRRCMNSYLYGADLATPASKAQYFASRNMTPKTELSLFNNYAQALLSGTDNMSVNWAGPEDMCDSWLQKTAFSYTWNTVSTLKEPTVEWDVAAADSTDLWATKSKLKVKTIAEDPVSGGEMWTFPNGIKVIYKKNTAVTGNFNWAMMIKGGYSSVNGLRKGEGAFFSDVLSTCKVSGFTGEEFQRLLKIAGIEMNCTVSSSDMQFSGSAKSGELGLVMRALLSIANSRTADQAAFDNYMEYEKAGLKPAVLDSLMYPDNLYSDVKTPSGLTDHTLESAQSCFSSSFVRCNDGMIVLVGDLSYDAVQKLMGSYVGCFRVSRGVSVRPNVSYKLRTGTTTYSTEGDHDAISIGLAASEPFTTESYMAFRIAGLVLQRRLTGEMGENGFSVKMTDQFKMFPAEVMEMVFDCNPVPDAGLPKGVSAVGADLTDVLGTARKTIQDVLSKPVSAEELNACKSLLTNSFSTYLATPSTYVDAIMLRYSSGKDIVTKNAERIGSVTADNVKTIFDALSGGIRIEYVVKEK